MKKLFVLSIVLTVALSAVQVHAAQDQAHIGQEQAVQPDKKGLSFRQKAFKKFNDTVARYKKCLRLKCDRSEYRKVARDVVIAAGVMFVALKAWQRLRRPAFDDWDALTKYPLGIRRQAYVDNLIARSDKEHPSIMAFNIARRLNISHDPSAQKMVDQFRFNDPQLRSILWDAVRHHNTGMIAHLLHKLPPNQINWTYRGWTLYRYATSRHEIFAANQKDEVGYLKRGINPFQTIINMLEESSKVLDKTPYSPDEGLPDADAWGMSLWDGYSATPAERRFGGKRWTNPSSPYSSDYKYEVRRPLDPE